MRESEKVTDLFALERGNHVCWIVERPSGYDAAVDRCAESGKGAREQVFVFGPPRPAAAGLPAMDGVTFANPAELFLGGEPLDAERMYAGFRQATAEARANGFEGVRVIADMDWLLPLDATPDDIVAFEVGLDEIVREVGATVVCAYRPSFDEATIARLTAIHPQTFGRPAREPGFRLWNIDADAWSLSGEIDSFNAPTAEDALSMAAARSRALRLDVSRLSFIDVAGMRALARIALQRPDTPVTLVGASTLLRRLWDALDAEAWPGVRLA